MTKTNDSILSLRNEGKSLRQIAKEIGISHIAVKKRLDKLVVNRLDDKPVRGDTITIDFDNGDLEYLWPDIQGAVSRLDHILKEEGIKDTAKVIIDTGIGWKFEKAW